MRRLYRSSHDSSLEEGVWSEPVSEVGVFAAWELRYSEAFMDDNSKRKRAISGSKTAESQSLPLAASPVIWILNC